MSKLKPNSLSLFLLILLTIFRPLYAQCPSTVSGMSGSSISWTVNGLRCTSEAGYYSISDDGKTLTMYNSTPGLTGQITSTCVKKEDGSYIWKRDTIYADGENCKSSYSTEENLPTASFCPEKSDYVVEWGSQLNNCSTSNLTLPKLPVGSRLTVFPKDKGTGFITLQCGKLGYWYKSTGRCAQCDRAKKEKWDEQLEKCVVDPTLEDQEDYKILRITGVEEIDNNTGTPEPGAADERKLDYNVKCAAIPKSETRSWGKGCIADWKLPEGVGGELASLTNVEPEYNGFLRVECSPSGQWKPLMDPATGKMDATCVDKDTPSGGNQANVDGTSGNQSGQDGSDSSGGSTQDGSGQTDHSNYTLVKFSTNETPHLLIKSIVAGAMASSSCKQLGKESPSYLRLQEASLKYTNAELTNTTKTKNKLEMIQAEGGSNYSQTKAFERYMEYYEAYILSFIGSSGSLANRKEYHEAIIEVEKAIERETILFSNTKNQCNGEIQNIEKFLDQNCRNKKMIKNKYNETYNPCEIKPKLKRLYEYVESYAKKRNIEIQSSKHLKEFEDVSRNWDNYTRSQLPKDTYTGNLENCKHQKAAIPFAISCKTWTDSSLKTISQENLERFFKRAVKLSDYVNLSLDYYKQFDLWVGQTPNRKKITQSLIGDLNRAKSDYLTNAQKAHSEYLIVAKFYVDLLSRNLNGLEQQSDVPSSVVQSLKAGKSIDSIADVLIKERLERKLFEDGLSAKTFQQRISELD